MLVDTKLSASNDLSELVPDYHWSRLKVMKGGDQAPPYAVAQDIMGLSQPILPCSY